MEFWAFREVLVVNIYVVLYFPVICLKMSDRYEITNGYICT